MQKHVNVTNSGAEIKKSRGNNKFPEIGGNVAFQRK